MAELSVLNQKISYIKIENEDYISITDMLKSKDGDFFVSDGLRNRNTIDYKIRYTKTIWRDNAILQSKKSHVEIHGSFFML